ncbi:MAG TPA: TIGR00266 family protein, partial [Vicinamibacterales bacterium]|nr:TIGR00266 family protein [Vicinamibacterales bacterium]
MAQEQWYMAIGGHQVGPVSQEDVVTNLRNGTIDGNTLVFSAGMANWTPLKDVPAMAAYLTSPASRAAAAAAAPPPITPGKRAHEIDFRILGSEMQFVEVELDPGESAVAEAGSMMYMTPGIQMETVFGDGSQQQRSGVMGALLGAGKRLITGESLFMTVFTNQGAGKQQVSFAAPYPGKILAMDLKQLGGTLICQKDSFLCAARGVSIGIAFQRKIGVGLFGGEGFIMQRLEGDGLTFCHAGGTVHPVDLAPGQTLRVDTGCLVALQPSVAYDIQYVGKIKTAFFGGEGLFYAQLTGPGRVWLQSLPLSRMADRIYKAAPAAG